MHDTIAGDPHLAYGETDLWDLWLLDEGERVQCRETRLFLHYLHSASTKSVGLYSSDSGRGSVGIKLVGPVADDGEKHALDFRLLRGDVDKLSAGECRDMVLRLSDFFPPVAGHINHRLNQVLLALGLSVQRLDIKQELMDMTKRNAARALPPGWTPANVA